MQKKVQEVLEKSQLSKREVCRRSKLARPTLEKLLNGKEVNVSSLEAYARTMNVEIGYFFDSPTASQTIQHLDSSDKSAVQISRQEVQMWQERVKMLEALLSEKDKLLQAKDEIINYLKAGYSLK
jgi:transcriptional regulator with XRE-family HTH domain